MAALALLTFGAGWISVVSCPVHQRNFNSIQGSYLLNASSSSSVWSDHEKCHQILPHASSKWHFIEHTEVNTDCLYAPRNRSATRDNLESCGHGGPLSWTCLGRFPGPDPGFCHLVSTARMMACVHRASAFSRHRATVCTPCAHCYHARGRKWLPFTLSPHLSVYLLTSPLQTWMNAEWA